VCRQAVWSQQTEILRRLARLPRPDVRAVALTGLSRVGCDADVAAYDAARRAGIDALDRYRTAVTAAEPAVGAIAGLADNGSQADEPLVRKLLTHPAAPVRAQAVRALRHLDAVPVEQMIQMLRDPSASVVREATLALRPLTRAVPAGVAWELLADPDRVELRRAGYRLLRMRGTREQLLAALLLATDPGPGLARRAVADATRLAETPPALTRVG
jgi:HEAT repeat protein